MSVTAIPSARRSSSLAWTKPARRRPPSPAPRLPGPPSSSGTGAAPLGDTAAATLTITLQISVTGPGLPPVADQVLRELRALAEQLDDVTVTLAPAAEDSIVDGGLVTEPLRAVLAADPAESTTSLLIQPASRTVLRNGRPVRLTRREFDLLLFLAQHPRRVFSRDQLLTQVWGYEWIGGSRTVDVHIRRLRLKLGQAGPVVCTVHGVGYRLDEEVQVTIESD